MYDRNEDLRRCDYWLIPLYAARRKHWILGVIELSADVRRKPVVFKYIDCHPLHAWSPSAQGSEWVFLVSAVPLTSCFRLLTSQKVLQRFYAVAIAFLERRHPENVVWADLDEAPQPCQHETTLVCQ